MKIGCGAVQVLPRTVFWMADRLAPIGYHCFRGFRNRSVANIRIALGDRLDDSAIEATARRSLRNFFRACVEAGAAVKASDDALRAAIPVVGREHLDAALAKGNGVLLLSAHLGNFFLIGSRLALESYPSFVLVNQPRDGRFAELMDEYRLRVRQRTIHARPRRQALRELNAVLRQNKLVVMIADEFRQGHGVPVPFFGGTVISRRGPVTLALRTGAAIVPAYLVRQTDDSLKLIIEPELDLERSGKGSAEVKENTVRMAQWLERTVRRYPDQWNWMNIRHWAESRNKLVRQQPLQRAV
ncbi:MAG: lysophospholipid acyltransferase family protein [Candidatus Binatia bacterium]